MHHFGGFFSADWRRNDILWGRLDAAERLISALWPASADGDGTDEDGAPATGSVHRAIRAHAAIIARRPAATTHYRALLGRLVPRRPAGAARARVADPRRRGGQRS